MIDVLFIICSTSSSRLEVHGDEGKGLHPSPGSVAADGEFEWLSPDTSVRLEFNRGWRDILLLAEQYDLCMTGKAHACQNLQFHIVASGVKCKPGSLPKCLCIRPGIMHKIVSATA